MAFISIENAIEELKKGKLLIVTDDKMRENEGDFIAIAESITSENINLMVTHGRGLVCVPMTEKRLRELDLPPMVNQNNAKQGTAFTISVDALKETTTGISAFDRSNTIRTLADPKSKAKDFARPGHIFPLTAAKGGVLRRAGHTEAVIDLARMAGFQPVGVLCEILDDDGTMARSSKLLELADQLDLGIITIADLIEYRRRTEKLITQQLKVKFPTKYGEFDLFMYESTVDEMIIVALIKGDIGPDDEILVRVHSQCITGDLLSSLRCECGGQLELALQKIQEEGKGVLIYMPQEGRGIGLANKLRAYALQDEGMDTVEANQKLGFPADLRDYGIGAQILLDLGVRKMRLMTNNPKKIIGLDGYGLQVVDRVPIQAQVHDLNENYLKTKKNKMGHLLDVE